ncbi:P-II family nitrogen regulator [Methylacidimicrobium sp. B4]|uniref:P-II family nitrogen regulator n=1 Tax=Methylacidimicrobium sp. B4 TaxID=2796139 RepID=UPI001A8FC6D9|nr:P-II family nitrogen regulator [Methylacidimicrobium sp. B4]QSR84589.1 P-II family nitrogen regulator [Methylacidimicrobium sp. B4]
MEDQPTTHGPVLSTRLFQKVEAVIPRFCLGDLRDALADRGIEGALVSRVKRFEKAPEEVERYLGKDYLPDFLPQTKIELILPVDLVPAAVKTILRKARVRDPQDRILLSPVLRVISIDPPREKSARAAELSDGPLKLRAEAAQSLR